MLLAVPSYIVTATIYFVVIAISEKQDAESRKRRFPRYKSIYKTDYKTLTIRAILFPYDITRKAYSYSKWRFMK